MAPREEECVGQILSLPKELSSFKEIAVSLSDVQSHDKDDITSHESQNDLNQERCSTSVVESFGDMLAGLPMSQIMLKVAEESLDKVGQVLEKTGVGASSVKNVQRTTRRVRRAGARTGISRKLGQIVFQVAEFVGANFFLGFSGLRLEMSETAKRNKVVSFSEANSEDCLHDLLNEDYPEESDPEDDPDFVPDFVPGDEDYQSSSDEDDQSSLNEEDLDDESHEEKLEAVHTDKVVDAIVPVVVKHEMVDPEEVCVELKVEVEEVIFEDGHCVPKVIKSESLDEDEVQFEGHSASTTMKTGPMESEETGSNSSYLNLVDRMDNLNIVDSLAKDNITATNEVENSPAIVLDEIGPVSARISALERVVELEKSPKINKVKIAGGSGNCSDKSDTDTSELNEENIEAQEFLEIQVNEGDKLESYEINEEKDESVGADEHNIDSENKETEEEANVEENIDNSNCEANNETEKHNGSEGNIPNEGEPIEEIEIATSDSCKKVENVPEY